MSKSDPRGVRVKNHGKGGKFFPAVGKMHLQCYPEGRGEFLLGPGEADLPYEYLMYVSQNETVDAWFKSGFLEIVEITPSFEGDRYHALKPDTLTGMKEDAALFFAKTEDDPDVLTGWLDGETRPKVVDALSAKLPKPKKSRKRVKVDVSNGSDFD